MAKGKPKLHYDRLPKLPSASTNGRNENGEQNGHKNRAAHTKSILPMGPVAATKSLRDHYASLAHEREEEHNPVAAEVFRKLSDEFSELHEYFRNENKKRSAP